MTQTLKQEQVRATVRAGYTRIARQGRSCCGSTGGSRAPAGLAGRLGYDAAELAALPAGANMGLSCGNPTAVASLQPGEVVLDLGSGGGFDVFLAGRKVGPTGRAIGIDMTAEMLAKARRNIAGYRKQSGLDNVEFRLGEIEHLPVADGSVDVVISNCVINLSPDKPQVWREIARVLKPGGRVAVSDLALLRSLPVRLKETVAALVGCVAGAELVTKTRRMVRAAGLEQLRLKTNPDYVRTMIQLQDPLYRSMGKHLPRGTQPADFITSLAVTARKPGCCWTGH